MAGRWTPDLTWANGTPKSHFLNRRQILAGGAAALGAASIGAPALAQATKLNAVASEWSTDLEPTAFKDITQYCNYYEFGPRKDDPAKYAHMLPTQPSSVKIDGMVDNPGDYGLEDILANVTLEERIYRFRCVEAWSMVIPWVGFELKDLLDRAGVQDGAKYVAFETVYRPEEMPGTAYRVLDWPYREGLRLDEAMHPLTIMATGIYDEPLKNQNGAPIRLVVPWKYGFKSIKSIVRITVTDQQPPTSWNMAGPREYGFYSNVNPEVDHPRWSQASERVIGSGLFARRQDTLMFNGYEEHVASLYEGMDLAEFY